ncbi:hypothetical protein OHA10_39200 [Kribbella sp. NBC_00662]|uniref:hypothetical protein n=1 Tax=Kribbella sp. NBC_00662 TaxID=2975969 RepID=UPI00324B0DA6
MQVRTMKRLGATALLAGVAVASGLPAYAACWASGTAVAPGGDTSATFHGGPVGAPFVTIDSVSQGRLKQIVGAHTYLHLGTNANVNTRGEFWIGYKKIAAC